MEQRKCSFCGEMLEPGTGRLYVKKDGAAYFLCSSKCLNNMKLGRIPRKVAWTEKARTDLNKKN